MFVVLNKRLSFLNDLSTVGERGDVGGVGEEGRGGFVDFGIKQQFRF